MNEALVLVEKDHLMVAAATSPRSRRGTVMSNRRRVVLALGVASTLFAFACSRPDSVGTTRVTDGKLDIELSELFEGAEARVDLGHLSSGGWETVGPGPDLNPSGPVVLTQTGVLVWSATESRMDFQLARYGSE
ncbi:MAG: hypothetical protein ABR609_06135, partial [Acidimicrobiia bacterium]